MWLALIRNLRSAGRQYLREPLMVSIAILPLAASMGAGTYLFGVVNLLLLTPPPDLLDELYAWTSRLQPQAALRHE